MYIIYTNPGYQFNDDFNLYTLLAKIQLVFYNLYH